VTNSILAFYTKLKGGGWCDVGDKIFYSHVALNFVGEDDTFFLLYCGGLWFYHPREKYDNNIK
jgi:hypothetical protein